MGDRRVDACVPEREAPGVRARGSFLTRRRHPVRKPRVAPPTWPPSPPTWPPSPTLLSFLASWLMPGTASACFHTSVLCTPRDRRSLRGGCDSPGVAGSGGGQGPAVLGCGCAGWGQRVGACHGPFGEKTVQVTEWGTEGQRLAQVLPLVTGGVRTEPRRSGSESPCQSRCCAASKPGWDEVPPSGFL